jgi:hypothetical protein
MAPGTNAIVYLHLRTPDHESADCTIKVNKTATFIDDLGFVPSGCTASGEVEETTYPPMRRPEGLSGRLQNLRFSGKFLSLPDQGLRFP